MFLQANHDDNFDDDDNMDVADIKILKKYTNKMYKILNHEGKNLKIIL